MGDTGGSGNKDVSSAGLSVEADGKKYEATVVHGLEQADNDKFYSYKVVDGRSSKTWRKTLPGKGEADYVEGVTPRPQELTAKRKPKPIKVMAYLDTDDAVVTVQAIQHLQKMLSKSGYAENQIIEVERGSVWIKMMAWWNEENGSPAAQSVKDKVLEYGSVSEEAAKDILFNERRSKISRENAETFSLYMDRLSELDNAAISADGWLIIKVTDAQGRKSMVTQKLSLEHQRILEKNPSMLRDPSRILENLGLETQMSIES